MKDYIKALKEIENEDETFELTLSKKEVLDLVKEIERLKEDKKKAIEYINDDKNLCPKNIKVYINELFKGSEKE